MEKRKMVWNDTYPLEKGFIIEYRFEQSDWKRDLRSDEPFKTVHRESLKMSSMSVVGNVGGTLGMFIGFSFIGTSRWFVDLIGKWYAEISRKFTDFKRNFNP